MGTGSDEDDLVFGGFIQKQPIRLHMTFSRASVLPDEKMVLVPCWKFLLLTQGLQHRPEFIEILSTPLQALDVSSEL
jgi:hypothetical protein